jgi:hypothetical protein
MRIHDARSCGVCILLAFACLLSSRGFGAEWKHMGPGGEAPVYRIYSDADGRIYLNYNTDKLYRSSNDGTSWQLIFDGGPEGYNTSFYNVFIKSPTTYILENYMVTINGGENWSLNDKIKSPLVPLAIRADGMMIAGIEGVYMQGGGKIVISRDLGDTWTTQTLSTSYKMNAAFFGKDGRIYCKNKQDVFRSDDDGKTWNRVYHVVPVESIVSAMALGPAGHLFLAEADPLSGHTSFLRSTDLGTTWKTYYPYDSWAGEIYNMTVSPTGDVYFIDGFRLYRFEEQTEEISAILNATDILPPSAPPTYYLFHVVHATANGDLYLGTDKGLFQYDQKVPVALSGFTVE